ncbi:hypothetical protein MKK75_10170 [Methylobacterium sp. J-030]|uniref:hypothetical protein n=1 Tax=Methylobacterium sp. J-030 TaxID=2836627 RepID=UPI001FBB4AF2|nr:hypothetical protein [Methylobacterium sp. J-030]MCJ2069164.1 hypothetical protein [Methylobacterium sp. J-030]
MNAPFRNSALSADLALDAAAEAAAIAESYARAAQEFASVGDHRGLAYALRCASKAILSANEAALLGSPNFGGV